MLILKNGWKIRAYTTEGSALVKFSAHYALSNSTTLTEDVVRGALSASGGAANAVDVLTGPSASPTDNRIDVKTLTFVNGETTTKNLTVELYDGSNASPLVGTVPLQANGSVVIADAVSIFDAQGRVVTVNGSNGDSQPIGTVLHTVAATAPDGWLLCDGKTVGNASSGSSGRANADTWTLYDLIYNGWTDADAPLLTSAGAATTRAAQGTSSVAFAAGVRLTIPDLRGRAIIGRDIGGAAARVTAAVAGLDSGVLGKGGGDQNLHQHTHVFAATESGTPGSLNLFSNNGTSTVHYMMPGNSGSGTSQNVQPSIVLSPIVKYASVAVLPPTTVLQGVTDGSDAGAGIVGEYLESVESPATVHAAPATSQYFDLTSLTLSAGDWDVTAVTLGRPNGAMNGALGVSCYMGIGRVAGNNNAGLVQSKNAVNVDCGTATSYVTLSVPSYRMKITAADVSGGTNIAYIKALMTYLSGAPGFVGYRLSARRVR